MQYMLGVDVGGTFTDLTLVHTPSGGVAVHKVRSTPDDPSRAIMTGIAELLQREGVGYEALGYLAHGTTVATNALIEKRGARTALLVTKGFRDLLDIADQTRPSLYDLQTPAAAPVIPPDRRFEVDERVGADGLVVNAVDMGGVDAVIAQIAAADPESVAICFLFSFLNPAHELAVAERVRAALPNAFVSTSADVVPEFREYPRLSTTVLNAYLGPVVRRYLERFARAVLDAGVPVSPYVTQSNGGVLSIAETIAAPIRIALSGPSAGVVASAHLCRAIGHENLITFDMGGTSADISLIQGGTPLVSLDRRVERFPVRVPMLDIVTIGAGGGSIAQIDEGGALKVGPRSAGAAPGPACYGNGGNDPTVTDANAVLGRVNPAGILGGSMSLDVDAARRVIDTRIASPMGVDVTAAAEGIVRVINATMVRAVRGVSVQRGHDPSDFTLVAFGGAGPLHAVELADELGIPRIVVPAAAGTLCSYGLVVADVRVDGVRSELLHPAKLSDAARVPDLLRALMADGRAVLEKEGIPSERQSFELWVEARYRFQNYELPVAVSLEEADLAAQTLAQTVVDRFHAEHARVYGHARPRAAVEFVNVRCTAVGSLPKAEARRLPHRAARDAPLEPGDVRPVFFRSLGGHVPCAIYQRDSLRAGDVIPGPAVVEQLDTTTLLPPGYVITVDEWHNLHITNRESA
jgi:N-methylhydantoinase A